MNKLLVLFITCVIPYVISYAEGEKPFVILIASYNNEKYAEANIISAITQQYSNYRVIFINDCSSDDTLKIVEDTVNRYNARDKVLIIDNKIRKLGLRNYYEAIINHTLDEEIIINLDGDDCLNNKKVLAILNQIYSQTKREVWLTYGQFIGSKSKSLGWNIRLPSSVIRNNDYRNFTHVPTHLRTFYSWLFKKINLNDLMYEGHFFEMTWDCAFMFPMLEMSAGRFYFINKPLYLYNEDNPINDHKVNMDLQRFYSNYIRSLPKYKPLNHSIFTSCEQTDCILCNENKKTDIYIDQAKKSSNASNLDKISNENDKISITPLLSCCISDINVAEYVSNHLIGQLGNQMFQIAAAVSLALDNGAAAVFPELASSKEYNIPLNYAHVFSCFDVSLPSSLLFTEYKEPHFHFAPIPYTPNMSLSGYFQSERYFKHNKDDIIKLFSPSQDILDYLYGKYPDILSHPKTVSIHIRMYKDTKPEFHPFIGWNYIHRAIKQFDPDSLFVVFSDQIEYCKKKLEKLAHTYNIVFIEGNYHFQDLYLMSLCKHNILSNSSFSWWGAYLNKNPEKIVIAPSPKRWFGPGMSHCDTKDLLPSEWKILF